MGVQNRGARRRRIGNVEAPRSRSFISAHRTRKEGAIAGTGKTTQAKREREKSRQQKQREKEARRVERKAAKLNRPTEEGEDPDLAGLHWGPQAPLY